MLDNMLTPFYHAPVPLWALVDAFFLYSFLGWCMECVVIRREKGAWENRGFVKSPFCIIYGFGAMLGYALLRPFSGSAAIALLQEMEASGKKLPKRELNELMRAVDRLWGRMQEK